MIKNWHIYGSNDFGVEDDTDNTIDNWEYIESRGISYNGKPSNPELKGSARSIRISNCNNNIITVPNLKISGTDTIILDELDSNNEVFFSFDFYQNDSQELRNFKGAISIYKSYYANVISSDQKIVTLHTSLPTSNQNMVNLPDCTEITGVTLHINPDWTSGEERRYFIDDYLSKKAYLYYKLVPHSNTQKPGEYYLIGDLELETASSHDNFSYYGEELPSVKNNGTNIWGRIITPKTSGETDYNDKSSILFDSGFEISSTQYVPNDNQPQGILEAFGFGNNYNGAEFAFSDFSITVKYPNPKYFYDYKFSSSKWDDNKHRTPSKWKIEGSVDNVNWYELDHMENEVPKWLANETRHFVIPYSENITRKYRYIRFSCLVHEEHLGNMGNQHRAMDNIPIRDTLGI